MGYTASNKRNMKKKKNRNTKKKKQKLNSNSNNNKEDKPTTRVCTCCISLRVCARESLRSRSKPESSGKIYTRSKICCFSVFVQFFLVCRVTHVHVCKRIWYLIRSSPLQVIKSVDRSFFFLLQFVAPFTHTWSVVVVAVVVGIAA